MKNYENCPTTLSNHKNLLGTMKNPTWNLENHKNCENHENRLWSLKNHPGTLNNHKKPTWNHEKIDLDP